MRGNYASAAIKKNYCLESINNFVFTYIYILYIYFLYVNIFIYSISCRGGVSRINFFVLFLSPVMHLTVFQGRSLLLSSLSFWLAKGYGHDYQPEPCQSPGTFLSWLRGRKSMSATCTSCLKLNLWFKKKYFGKGFLAHYNSVIALDEVIVGHCCSLLYGTTRYKRVSLFCIILT